MIETRNPNTQDYLFPVELSGVCKNFLGSVALEGVSLSIETGQFVTISGHSGSGKSTLIRIMQGIENPDTGRARILGQEFTALDEKDKREIVSKRIGVGFQSPMLLGNFSVWENLRLASLGNGSEVKKEVILALANQFGLAQEKIFKKKASNLSGGEQMRVSLIRAIAKNPELVLLDEPTSAIDTKGKYKIFETLRVLSDLGTTVIAVTHDADISRQFAHREVILESGRIIN